LRHNPSFTVVRVVGLAIAVCVSASESRADARPPTTPSYALTVWATESGLPGDVFAISQDLEGYLWLGTPTGLLRFDGSRFVPWAPADKAEVLPKGPVHALVGAHDGSLWVGIGGGGGVVRIDRGHLVRYEMSDGAPPGATDMIEDRQGVIWVASRRGLFRYFDGKWTRMGEAEGYTGAEAFSLLEDRAGRLWVGTASGVYLRTNTAFESMDATSTNVQSFAEDDSGAIWITDANNIVRKLSTHTTPKHGSAIRLPASGWRLLHDRRGQLWVAAWGGGLLRVSQAADGSAAIERFEYEHRLAGSPRSLYEDREGNVWVGMRGGLMRLSESSFTSDVPLDGVTHDGVRTAAVSSDGSVWIATGHSLNRFSQSARTVYSVAQPLALHTDQRGVMWVSSAQGIGRFVNGKVEPVSVSQQVAWGRVGAITTDSRGLLWLCSTLKGVMAWNGHDVTRFEEEGDITNRPCNSIYTDRHDRVWVGFQAGGAAVYDKGVFQTFGERDGFTAGTVLSIIEDRSGAVWFGTSSGLSRYANGRFTAITLANVPLADVVPTLVEDEEGYVWLGVNTGTAVLRIHPREVDKLAGNPSYHLEYALYDASDGIQQGPLTWQSGVGAVRAGDGRLWIATGLGVTIIDPRSLPRSRRPSAPRIEAVSADGRLVTPTRDLALPYGISTLHIEYGALSLSSASKLRFRYMLEGVDDDWVYAGHRGQATYAALPSGGYRFRVSATHDGQWTEPEAWEFSVASPFYLTRWFFTFGACAVVLLLASAWGLRLRAVRNQYALVFAERARVSREIHDTLLQSLAAIGVELEVMATELGPSQISVRDGLRRLRRQVGHSLREARESIVELRHNPMKARGLIDSLRDLANNTTRTKGVEAEFSVTGRLPQCSAEVDIQLFRIAQEAVNNAIKHGHARRIQISVVHEKDRIVLTVADDGCGFTADEHDPAPAVGEHLGLLNMRERAARVRGRLMILSSPGHGTTIETTIPLSAA
jgi:signal transduction histidine kinase/ligand-binding sensor domain-containing protein